MRDESRAEPEPEPQAPRAKAAALAREALLARRSSGGSVLTIALLVVFAVLAVRDSNLRSAIVLLGAVVFHECGHLLGMRWFGFTDLRMFFLPGIGAAASGRKPGASAVEHAIVVLAGPLPGIMLAAALVPFAPRGWLHAESTPLLTEIAFMLAVLNAVNLAPIVPFDGGRLFETLLFARWPALDAAFRLLGIGGLAWFAYHGTPLLGVVAGLMLLSLPRHARIGYEALRLRRERTIAAEVDALGDDDLVALFDAAQRVLPTGGRALIDSTIAQLHDRAARRPAGWLPSCGLLLLWLLGIVLAVGVVVGMAVRESR